VIALGASVANKILKKVRLDSRVWAGGENKTKRAFAALDRGRKSKRRRSRDSGRKGGVLAKVRGGSASPIGRTDLRKDLDKKSNQDVGRTGEGVLCSTEKERIAPSEVLAEKCKTGLSIFR